MAPSELMSDVRITVTKIMSTIGIVECVALFIFGYLPVCELVMVGALERQSSALFLVQSK